jgi:hypothetical protein
MRALRPSRLFGFCKQDVAILATLRPLPTKGGTVCHVHNQFAIITVLPRGRCPRPPGVLKALGKAQDIRFIKVGESCNSPWLASVAIPSGYPSAGCSPAEPASVSPDMVILMLLESSVNLLMVPCSQYTRAAARRAERYEMVSRICLS